MTSLPRRILISDISSCVFSDDVKPEGAAGAAAAITEGAAGDAGDAAAITEGAAGAAVAITAGEFLLPRFPDTAFGIGLTTASFAVDSIAEALTARFLEGGIRSKRKRGDG